jgi:hypothetical protein
VNVVAAYVLRMTSTLLSNIARCSGNASYILLAEFLEVTIAAPIFEEALKRQSLFAEVLFVWMEFFHYMLQPDTRPRLALIISRLYAVGLHHFARRLKYDNGVLFHSFNNLIAFTPRIIQSLIPDTGITSRELEILRKSVVLKKPVYFVKKALHKLEIVEGVKVLIKLTLAEIETIENAATSFSAVLPITWLTAAGVAAAALHRWVHPSGAPICKFVVIVDRGAPFFAKLHRALLQDYSTVLNLQFIRMVPRLERRRTYDKWRTKIGARGSENFSRSFHKLVGTLPSYDDLAVLCVLYVPKGCLTGDWVKSQKHVKVLDCTSSQKSDAAVVSKAIAFLNANCRPTEEQSLATHFIQQAQRFVLVSTVPVPLRPLVNQGMVVPFCDEITPMSRCHVGFCAYCPRAEDQVLCDGHCMSCIKSLPMGKPAIVNATAKLRYKMPKFPRKDNMKGLYAIAPVMSRFVMCAAASCRANESVALTKRALAAVPTPNPIVFADFADWVFKKDNRAVWLPLPVEYVRPITASEFNHLGGFPQATKAENLEAERAMYSRRFTDKQIMKEAQFGMFVKHDKTDKTNWNGPLCHETTIPNWAAGYETPFYPRAIQCCRPIARVATGCFFRGVQEYFHRAWRGNLLFACGVNADELSLWFSERAALTTTYAMDDFSFFDSTQSASMHQLLVRIYNLFGLDKLRCNRMASRIRTAQISSAGSSVFGYQYRVQGTMRSGVADTCLGNTLINVLTHFYCICRENSISLKEAISRVSMTALGDDNLILTDSRTKFRNLKDNMVALGFLPKLQVSTDINDITFLNMRPYPVAIGYKFAPKIGRIICRMGWSADRRWDIPAFNYGVAYGFKASTAHVPILSDYVQRILTQLVGFDRQYHLSNEYRRSQEYNITSHTSTLEDSKTRQFCCQLYSITEMEMKALRSYVAALPVTVCAVDHPLLNRVIARDL